MQLAVVAGTGCDAAPYFRIFNPWIQQKKFDPEAAYIKKWVLSLEKCLQKRFINGGDQASIRLQWSIIRPKLRRL